MALGIFGLSAAPSPKLSPRCALGSGGSAELPMGVPSWVGMGCGVPGHVAGLEMEVCAPLPLGEGKVTAADAGLAAEGSSPAPSCCHKREEECFPWESFALCRVPWGCRGHPSLSQVAWSSGRVSWCFPWVKPTVGRELSPLLLGEIPAPCMESP